MGQIDSLAFSPAAGTDPRASTIAGETESARAPWRAGGLAPAGPAARHRHVTPTKASTATRSRWGASAAVPSDSRPWASARPRSLTADPPPRLGQCLRIPPPLSDLPFSELRRYQEAPAVRHGPRLAASDSRIPVIPAPWPIPGLGRYTDPPVRPPDTPDTLAPGEQGAEGKALVFPARSPQARAHHSRGLGSPLLPALTEARIAASTKAVTTASTSALPL